MGWLLELLFESVSEMCSKFIVDMMDVASGMFTEILSCDLDLFEELFGVAGFVPECGCAYGGGPAFDDSGVAAV